jgi:hypothetical protein
VDTPDGGIGLAEAVLVLNVVDELLDFVVDEVALLLETEQVP